MNVADLIAVLEGMDQTLEVCVDTNGEEGTFEIEDVEIRRAVAHRYHNAKTEYSEAYDDEDEDVETIAVLQ